MNKRALYESIMKRVAKEVKRAINENEYWDESFNDDDENEPMQSEYIDAQGHDTRTGEDYEYNERAWEKKAESAEEDYETLCKNYIKHQLVEYFDCGDDDYAEFCYNKLKHQSKQVYHDIIDYLYDHDDDNYIHQYAIASDAYSEIEMITAFIDEYYKEAYDIFFNTHR